MAWTPDFGGDQGWAGDLLPDEGKNMTKTTIHKIANKAGISINLIKVWSNAGTINLEMADLTPDVAKRNMDHARETGYRGNTLEVTRSIRKYNRQLKKLMAAIKAQGLKADFWGRLGGDGAWNYTNQRRTYADELVWNNID
jgi:hypothetical protein